MRYKNLSITWLSHAGFMIKSEENKIIYIDPFQIITEKKADVIFITHAHYDHCSIEDIKKIIQPHTIVVCGTDVQSKLGKVRDNIGTIIVEPGKEYEVAGLKVKTVAAYNKTKSFHPKENHWVGYIIKIGKTTLYHSGDTDLIPEMSAVKADVVLLPVGGTYTMNAEEATKAAQIIKPQLAIPMHWGTIVGSLKDAEDFVQICKEAGINAEILEKE